MLYGVVEIINNLKINGIRRQMAKAAKKTEEAGNKNNRFNKYPQRYYDYEELEKRLLGE